MAFITIHTNYGLQRLASAESTGVQINLTHMAVGDGNGNAVTPTTSQTQLVRERFRATINRVYQNESDPLRFTAELIIPADVGGFTLREVGVFDSDGSLFAVGNLPATYKPEPSDGAFSDSVVRLEFMVSNASTITLQIDPNVVVVTQQWISNNVTAGSIIPGGTTGQVLAKQSNSDGDVHWIDPTQANVVVDIIEDRQTLAAGQTVVDLVETITYGLAVYIEGVRINRGGSVDEWTPDPSIPSRLVLGKAYPESTSFLGVNNEPAGSAPAPLEKSKNLSDVESKSTSRNNLDVFSRSETRQMAPPGLISYFARNSAPSGWLKANGSAVSRSVYSDLFAVMGVTFGVGDGVNTFNLPDLRGEFIRGFDDGRGVDQSRVMGSSQTADIAAHSHNIQAWKAAYSDPTGGNYAVGSDSGGGGSQQADLVTKSSGGTETRPRNIALLACVKF